MGFFDPIHKGRALITELTNIENLEKLFFQAVSSAKIIIIKEHDIAGFLLFLIEQGIPFSQNAAAAFIVSAAIDSHPSLQVLSDVFKSPENLSCEMIAVNDDPGSREVRPGEIDIRSAHVTGKEFDFQAFMPWDIFKILCQVDAVAIREDIQDLMFAGIDQDTLELLPGSIAFEFIN